MRFFRIGSDDIIYEVTCGRFYFKITSSSTFSLRDEIWAFSLLENLIFYLIISSFSSYNDFFALFESKRGLSLQSPSSSTNGDFFFSFNWFCLKREPCGRWNVFSSWAFNGETFKSFDFSLLFREPWYLIDLYWFESYLSDIYLVAACFLISDADILYFWREDKSKFSFIFTYAELTFC